MDWELVKAFVAGQVRHFVTLAAGGLVTHGVLADSDKNAFVQIASGIVMWAIVAAWSWYQKVGQEKVAKALKRVTGEDTTPKAVDVAKATVPGAIAQAFVLFLGVIVALSFLGASANAQTRLQQAAKRNDVNALQSVSPLVQSDAFDLGGFKITDVLIQKVLPDLRYAAALSKQNNNKVTQPCLSAVLTLVDSWQVEVKDDSGNVLAIPDPHFITFLEKQSQLLRQLQPDSDISIGCSAMAQALRKDIMSLIGAILSGGSLGLFKLPVLPLP